MQKSTKDSGAVQAITNLARSKNSEIGSYVSHYDNFGSYRVQVSNGGLTISKEKVQDYNATGKLTDIQIQEVANSFVKMK
ncbi:hypothetical protein [Flavobacterium sp.]|uniref:hypothetical protein n=1 Tax=Flavobacterium sp. TaxID=239 RepID=UPI003D6BA406